jgi:hypothetical protein
LQFLVPEQYEHIRRLNPDANDPSEKTHHRMRFFVWRLASNAASSIRRTSRPLPKRPIVDSPAIATLSLDLRLQRDRSWSGFSVPYHV